MTYKSQRKKLKNNVVIVVVETAGVFYLLDSPPALREIYEGKTEEYAQKSSLKVRYA